MTGECGNPIEGCRYAPDCFASVHHLWWPKRNYKSKVERQFRELPENKEMLCRAEHDELHATEPIPEKPDRDYMLARIALAEVQDE